MGTKKHVVITGSPQLWSPSWWSLSRIVKRMGMTPIRITTRHKLKPNQQIHAAIISGGHDIGVEHYTKLPTSKNSGKSSRSQRDALEMKWVQLALKHQIPILGICRGAQLINVTQGGTLFQDIRKLRKNTRNRRSLVATKTVKVFDDSFLRKYLLKPIIHVNSLHFQAIDRLGKNLKVTGIDLDGFPQLIEHVCNPNVIGVQWHPEYLPYLRAQKLIFHHFKKLIEQSQSVFNTHTV